MIQGKHRRSPYLPKIKWQGGFPFQGGEPVGPLGVRRVGVPSFAGFQTTPFGRQPFPWKVPDVMFELSRRQAMGQMAMGQKPNCTPSEHPIQSLLK